MIRDNLHFRLCILMAFQTMLSHNKKDASESAVEKVVELAKQMNEFCNLYVSKAFPLSTLRVSDEMGAEKLDCKIEHHIRELRTEETTHLPEDRGMLIKLYDRLQQRKARRLQWDFYATVKEEKLADLVLRLLDEEIEEADSAQ